MCVGRKLKIDGLGEQDADEVQEPLAMVIDFVIELSCQTKPVSSNPQDIVLQYHDVNIFLEDFVSG